MYYTRAPVGHFPFGPGTQFHLHLSLSPGRPHINHVLESVIDKTVALGAGSKDDIKNSGVVVGVCGPVSLADSVSKEASKVDSSRRDQVGGVDLVEEYERLLPNLHDAYFLFTEPLDGRGPAFLCAG